MRKLSIIPVLLFAAILFSSCGESRPDDLPVTLNASAEKSYVLLASANNLQSPSVTFNLSDFAGVSQYKKWISTAKATTKSYIEVSGIAETDEVEMKDVSISLASDGNKSISLGSITTNKQFEIKNLDQLSFMQALMDEVVRNGSSKVVLRYTPAINMSNPEATLVIKIDTDFTFN